jgi:predicted TIM-barrel fold metal-dependent hydrolase
VPNWPDHVTGDEIVAAMDKVGVDGAIFISAFSMYRYDAIYAVEVQRAHPGRFAIVKPVDPDDPAVGSVIADWKQTPGAVGIRIMMTKEAKREPNDPGLDRILRAAVKHDFPVNILSWGNLDAAADLVRRQAAVIVGNGPAVEVVRSAAAATPIVFVIGDPVNARSRRQS